MVRAMGCLPHVRPAETSENTTNLDYNQYNMIYFA